MAFTSLTASSSLSLSSSMLAIKTAFELPAEALALVVLKAMEAPPAIAEEETV